MTTTRKTDFKPGTLVRFRRAELYHKYTKGDLGIIISVHLVTNILKFMILHVNCGLFHLCVTSAPDWLYEIVT